MTSKEKYQELVAKGKCPTCGKEKSITDRFTFCLKCRISIRKSQKDRRELALRKGICPRCHKKPLHPGNKKCKDCLIEHNKNNNYQPITDENKRQERNTKRKNRYYKLKEEGKCLRCKVELKRVQLEGEDFVHCSECRSFLAKKQLDLYYSKLKAKKPRVVIRNERLRDAFLRASEDYNLVFSGVRPVKDKSKCNP
jgi:hypothetical protein